MKQLYMTPTKSIYTVDQTGQVIKATAPAHIFVQSLPDIKQIRKFFKNNLSDKFVSIISPDIISDRLIELGSTEYFNIMNQSLTSLQTRSGELSNDNFIKVMELVEKLPDERKVSRAFELVMSAEILYTKAMQKQNKKESIND